MLASLNALETITAVMSAAAASVNPNCFTQWGTIGTENYKPVALNGETAVIGDV